MVGFFGDAAIPHGLNLRSDPAFTESEPYLAVADCLLLL